MRSDPYLLPNTKIKEDATDIWDLITFAAFGDDRLRGLCMARGRVSHFPHWFASSP